MWFSFGLAVDYKRISEYVEQIIWTPESKIDARLIIFGDVNYDKVIVGKKGDIFD